MTLSAGTRLGPYELVAPLGAGCMGEIYRARDTRLKRTVAITGTPQTLFQTRVGMPVETHFRPSKYDVAADGRFLNAFQASDEPPPPPVLVLNWAEALKPRS